MSLFHPVPCHSAHSLYWKVKACGQKKSITRCLWKPHLHPRMGPTPRHRPVLVAGERVCTGGPEAGMNDLGGTVEKGAA